MQKLTTTFLLSIIFFITLTGCSNKTENAEPKETKTEDADFESEKIEVTSSQPLNVNFSFLDDSLSTKAVTIIPDSGRYECAIKINTSANWLVISHPSGATQRHEFPNYRGGNKYKLDFVVTTNLHKDSVKIYDYYYQPLTGGVGDFKQMGVVTDCNNYTLGLKYYIYTYDKKMTGKFVILYTKK